MATTTLDVYGMSCDGCEEIVEGALTEVDGVDSATADRETDTATVEGDANVDDLVDAVDFAGYEAQAGGDATAEETDETEADQTDEAGGDGAEAEEADGSEETDETGASESEDEE